MPLFEFVCSQCSTPFEALVRSASAAGEVACPQCGSADIRKKISTFAAKLSGSGGPAFGSSASAPACSPGGG